VLGDEHPITVDHRADRGDPVPAGSPAGGRAEQPVDPWSARRCPHHPLDRSISDRAILARRRPATRTGIAPTR